MVRCYPSWHAIRFIATKHADHHEFSCTKYAKKSAAEPLFAARGLTKAAEMDFIKATISYAWLANHPQNTAKTMGPWSMS